MRENAEHLAPWSPQGSSTPNARAIRAVAVKIAQQRRLWKNDLGYALLIVGKVDDRTVIGRVQLNAVVRGVFQNAYLGYWMAESRQGSGLMPEAVRAAVDWAF